ncbi:hypothetical protein COOONC_25603, partial [Cooperia oncophora]
VNAKILKDVKFPLILDLCDICTPALQERLRPQRAAVKKEEDAKIERMRKHKMEGTDPSVGLLLFLLPFTNALSMDM